LKHEPASAITPQTNQSDLTASPDHDQQPRQWVTPRSVVIALILTILSGFWVKQSEIVALACQGTEAVPSIPGVGALIFLILLNGALRRQKLIRPLTTTELITIFLFVTVATFMFACGIGRFLIACLTAPFYYTSPDAPLEELAQFIPAWMAPADAAVHKWVYESSPTGHVPWDAWRWPIVSWVGFLTVFGGTLTCLMVLFNDPWVHDERLVFPLVRLPLQMIDPEYSDTPFFRTKAAWIGIGIALVLNAINIVRGVFFGGPSGGMTFDLGTALTGAPWDALRPLVLHFRPELVGLGYLISTELSFSIWFFYLFNKMQAVTMSMVGYRVSGMPFEQEQGIGAYIVLAVILFWKARVPFKQAMLSILRLTRPGDEPAPAVNQWALIGSLVGFLAVILFARAAGMALWLAVLYFAILVSVAVVYARLRAETGVPLVWAFPYGQQHKVIKYFTNSQTIVGLGPEYRSATIFSLFVFLSRGFFPAVSGYGIEGLTLGHDAGLRKSAVLNLLVGAIAVGSLASFWFHLTPYYEEGAVGLRGGLWGAANARAEYAAVWKATQMPVAPEAPRIIATLSGGAFLGLLTVIRAMFFGSPLHPLGYAMACSYGSLLWGSFFLVWLAKSVLLRYGGHKAYLNALPGFLGFALGHFVVAGAIWGSLGAALGGPFLRYGVWFG